MSFVTRVSIVTLCYFVCHVVSVLLWLFIFPWLKEEEKHGSLTSSVTSIGHSHKGMYSSTYQSTDSHAPYLLSFIVLHFIVVVCFVTFLSLLCVTDNDTTDRLVNYLGFPFEWLRNIITGK
jgi:hypothetical protein